MITIISCCMDTLLQLQNMLGNWYQFKTANLLQVCAWFVLYFNSELQSDTATYLVTLQGACVRQFLQPVSNVSLGECLLLHENSYTPNEDFSYDATLRRCYPVVPKLPADFSCPSEDEVKVLLTRVNNEAEAHGPPPKLSMTGTAEVLDLKIIILCFGCLPST